MSLAIFKSASKSSVRQSEMPSIARQMQSMATMLRSLLVLVSIWAVPGVSSAYDEATAMKMAALSGATYASSPSPCIANMLPASDAWSLYTPLTSLVCDSNGNTCAFYTIASNIRKQIIVVFRGTTTSAQLQLEGWAFFQPVDFLGIGLVNPYFANALGVFWALIQATLGDANNSGFTVTFTGHSLGGAIASLAAARTVQSGLRSSSQVSLYTVGQPRVGNVAYATNFNSLVPNSYRVVFHNDPVPHMPPCSGPDQPCDPSSTGSYYHHSTEIWYPQGMPLLDGESSPLTKAYKTCTGPPTGEDFSCSDGIPSSSITLLDASSLLWDHTHYFEFKVKLSEFGQMSCSTSNVQTSCWSSCVIELFGTDQQDAEAQGCPWGVFSQKQACASTSFESFWGLKLGTQYLCSYC